MLDGMVPLSWLVCSELREQAERFSAMHGRPTVHSAAHAQALQHSQAAQAGWDGAAELVVAESAVETQPRTTQRVQ